MSRWKKSKFYHPFLIFISLIVAIIFYTGIVLNDDIAGRIIIGSVWLLVSAGWFGQFLYKRKPEQTKLSGE
jgi:hypothetical protein